MKWTRSYRKRGADEPRARRAGFTLAELIVATTVLAIVMAAVYTGFRSTLRTWRMGEAHLHTFQNARTAVSIMSRELGCILGGSEHLFEGKDDELEFFTVAPPMYVKKGEGARVLWVRYRLSEGRLNASDKTLKGKTLIREEAIVKKPLPLASPDGKEIDKKSVAKDREHKFYLADGVRGFNVAYYWIPPIERKPGETPTWIELIEKGENRQGWGLPQGIKVTLTLDDPNAEAGASTFTFQTTFRGPTSPYDEKKMGMRGEAGA
jgi:prepilin-type N-terminal cleavage/methylation domain-containing protein